MNQNLETVDPLFDDSLDRLVLFPIKHNDIWKYYETHLATFWTHNDIRESDKDKQDWEKLTKDEQEYIKNILAFFASSDNIVIENLATRFMNEVKMPEARQFYSIQICMEGVHSTTYCLLIDRLIKDPKEKDTLFNAVKTSPIIKKKADWALKWINDTNKFAERLLAFACVEKIGFISSFAGIFWLRKKPALPGVVTANEYISRDESLHGEFACYLYNNYVKEKLSTQRIHEIIQSATELEEEFVDAILPNGLHGINKTSMKQYVRYVADHLAVNLKTPKIYNDENPYDWMQVMGSSFETNFFEGHVSSYSKDRKGNIDEEHDDF